jgi:hypothetical protein
MPEEVEELRDAVVHILRLRLEKDGQEAHQDEGREPLYAVSKSQWWLSEWQSLCAHERNVTFAATDGPAPRRWADTINVSTTNLRAYKYNSKSFTIKWKDIAASSNKNGSMILVVGGRRKRTWPAMPPAMNIGSTPDVFIQPAHILYTGI